MSPQEIARLRATARRAARLEALLQEIADREEAALRAGIPARNERLLAEVIDLAYAVVVAMPPLPGVMRAAGATSPCVACLSADPDEAVLGEVEGVPR